MYTTKRNLELYEIVEKVQTTKSRAEKIEVLKQNNFSFLTDFLRCIFDPNIKFILPEGKPPYTPCQEESVPSSWRRQNVKLQYLVNISPKANQLKAYKRESIYIGILESVHPKDSLLLVDMINKKAPKSLTEKLVKEAFPNLF